jgi:hypothetical protein
MRREPAPDRVVVATAILAMIGFGGIAAALFLLVVISGFSSGHGAEGEGLTDAVVRVVGWVVFVPAIAMVALASAVGLHLRWRIGRPLGLIVSTMLVANAPVMALRMALGDRGSIELVAYHLFLVPPIAPWAPALGLLLGLALLWALLTRPSVARGPAPDSLEVSVSLDDPLRFTRRPRRISILAATLAIVGVNSLLPLVVRLASILAPVQGGLSQAPWSVSFLYAIASVGTTLLVLRAALALARGERLALLIAAPAALVGATWVGWWCLVVANEVVINLVPDSMAPVAGLVLAVGALVIVLPIAGLVLPITTRPWFEPDARLVAAARGARHRPARSTWAWLAASLAAAVASIGLLGVGEPADTPAEATEGEPLPHVVQIGKLEYYRIGWGEIPADLLAELEGSQPSSDGSAVASPVFSVAGFPSESVIAIAVPADAAESAGMGRVAVYVAEEAVPVELCSLLDLATVEGGQCVPERFVYNDRWYAHAPELRVPLDALTPTGVEARFEESPAAHVPTAVHHIVGVSPDVAVALRVPTAALTYRSLASGKGYPPELCPYIIPGFASDCDGG